MITRHFYDLNAVIEAFYVALNSHKNPLRKQQLCFWAYELFLSEEKDALDDLLDKALWTAGPAEHVWKRGEDPRHAIGLLCSLPGLPTPFPPPSSADSDATEPTIPAKTKIPTFPSKWSPVQRERLLRATLDAGKHRQAERLYQLLAPLTPKVALLYLSVIPNIPPLSPPLRLKWIETGRGLQHVLHALGFRGLSEANVCPVEWPSLAIGHLSARRFKHNPPPTCLHPAGLDIVFRGCQFWQRNTSEMQVDVAASQASDRLIFLPVVTDPCSALEAWYTKWFPDDIPDEWSAQERAKSHRINP